MGLAEELSYSIPAPNILQRSVEALASTRGGSWLMSKTLARSDRVLASWSGGRISLPLLLTGTPSISLTTTGRRSGQRRETALIGIPVGDTLGVLGTNFGGPHTPAWVLNLEADPRATVTHRGISRDVVARPATEAERGEVLANAAVIYGGYLKYQQRITGRRLRIFVLEPARS